MPAGNLDLQYLIHNQLKNIFIIIIENNVVKVKKLNKTQT